MEIAENKNGSFRAIAQRDGPGKAIVACEYRIGQGRLVVVGAPTPALNGMIGEAQNLDFLLSLIGKGPVILDDWMHGLGHEADATVSGLAAALDALASAAT